MSSHVMLRRRKFMYIYRIIRNGVTIKEVKRKRDLLVWRGQMVIAYLLSQGGVGTATTTWKVIASSNSTTPNMSDDSGDPEATEFNPNVGTPVAVTYTFEPTNKPSSEAQTYAHLKVKGSITVTTNTTLRKIGIIDQIATPNRHIVVEDAVVPASIIVGDILEIEYWYPLY